MQSDESRHISNGYATLLMALADEYNQQLLERDLRYAWWNNHRVVDAAIGTFIEYGTKDRRKDRESYAEMWRRWIYDDYYRSYLVPLEKYGLVIPHDLIEEAWNQIWNKGYVHEVAQFFATGWLANYWRIDPMTDKDFEWFEYKYPGWYDKYGKWWENYNRLSTPNGHHPIVAEDVDYQYPHRCWTCMVPCLVREDMVMDEVDGQWRTYCSRAVPLDRRDRVPADLPGPRDAEHGPADRASASGRRSTTAGTGPTSSATWATSATTARPWSPSRTSTSTRRRCGRSTTCAGCPRVQSPNVLLNEMTDDERAGLPRQLHPRWSRGPLRPQPS